jgi:predicted AlkP superfamily pyrophosphatase or phosphodiesterase
MKRRLTLVTFIFLTSTFQLMHAERPKLVVLIVLDQFPYSFLTRFDPYFSQTGFHYLMQHGANFTQANYRYATTKTGPGFAAISTGMYGHLNGIIGNKWYNREKKKDMGCVDDESVRLVGSTGDGKSPRNLATSTIGDMLRMDSNFRSKIIGISDKDRSAIFLAGKTGEAYWLDDSLLVTSSYYRQSVPAWVAALNTSGRIRQDYKRQWTETQPVAALSLCDDDDAWYEASPDGLGRTFPHFIVGNDSISISPSYYSALNTSPYATEYLFGAAEGAIVQESLGVRGVTDFIGIGVSGTDEIGHAFGPMSHEVFDNALRTDKMIGELLAFIDQKIGLDQCLVVLTSDHGIAPIPEYLKKKSPHIDAGRVSGKEISRLAEACLVGVFGNAASGGTWVERVVETDIYLNMKTIQEKGSSLHEVTHVLKDSLCRKSFVAAAYSREDLDHIGMNDHFGNCVAKSSYASRGGDLFLVLKPYYVGTSETHGTNHGQPYEYDSHVPIILFGKPFIAGTYRNEVSPIDIAPTLAEVLGIPVPPDCEGKVLVEAIR